MNNAPFVLLFHNVCNDTIITCKMMKSSFWGKNVLEFGFGVWNCINNFNSNTVREITLITFNFGT